MTKETEGKDSEIQRCDCGRVFTEALASKEKQRRGLAKKEYRPINISYRFTPDNLEYIKTNVVNTFWFLINN